MVNAYYVSGEAGHTVNCLARAQREYPRVFTPDTLLAFGREGILGGLVSFGDLSLSTGFQPNDVVDKFSANIKKVTQSPYFSGKPLYRDSGGFQIQTGKIVKSQVEELLAAHIRLIRMHFHVTRSFTLDIVPPEKPQKGSDYTFNSYDEVYDLNRQSLDTTLRLDPAMRRSVYAVYQFKTKRLHGMFNRLFFQEGRAGKFQNWAVGGMASSTEAFATPYIPWVLPLIEVTYAMKMLGRTKFGFHILGNAAFADDATKVLFAKLIEEVHGISVELTWDTNSIYNGFPFDRIFYYADESSRLIRNMKLGYDNLYRPDLGIALTPAAEHVYALCKQIVGLEKAPYITPEQLPLYLDETPTFFFYMIAVMNFFRAHKLSARWCTEESEELYSLWKANKRKDFAEKLSALMTRLDGARIKERVAQTMLSMEMLERLNPREAVEALHRNTKQEFPCLMN